MILTGCCEISDVLSTNVNKGIQLTSAHLLDDHGNTRSLSRSEESRYGEQLNKPSDKISGLCKTRFFD